METEYPYKRFLVFAGYNYYPGGGFNDYRGTADTFDESKDILKSYFQNESWGTWGQIVDIVTGEKTDFNYSDIF